MADEEVCLLAPSAAFLENSDGTVYVMVRQPSSGPGESEGAQRQRLEGRSGQRDVAGSGGNDDGVVQGGFPPAADYDLPASDYTDLDLDLDLGYAVSGGGDGGPVVGRRRRRVRGRLLRDIAEAGARLARRVAAEDEAVRGLYDV